MRKYKLEDVLKTEDVYHVDDNGAEWANYNIPDGQIGCIEVGTLKRGKWIAVKDYQGNEIEII